MTKDRLAELEAAADAQTYEDQVFVSFEERAGYSIEEFLQEVEQIIESIDKIKSNVEEVKEIYSSVLGLQKSHDSIESQLEDLMADIKRTATEVRAKLKVIEQSIELLEESSPMSAGLRIKTTQHSMLSHKFVEVLTDYNKTQIDYKVWSKARIDRQLEVSEYSGIITDIKQAKQILAEIEARHQADSIPLETRKSIEELNEILFEMEMLVEDQGEMIGLIENHVIQSREYVQDGKNQINKALAFQSKARKRNLIIIVTILVLLAAIIVYLIIQFS